MKSNIQNRRALNIKKYWFLLLVIFGFMSSSVFAVVIVSQTDSSETITGWGTDVHRWSFQNFDSFPGNLGTVKLRLKSTSGTDADCNYSSRVKVTAYDGNLKAYVASEQDITSSYEDYVFDFSSHHIPLASAYISPYTGLYLMYVEPVIPENPCFDWYNNFPPDIAGANHDISESMSPRLASFVAFDADPYIEVTSSNELYLPPISSPGLREINICNGAIDVNLPTIVLTHGLQPKDFEPNSSANTLWTSCDFGTRGAGGLIHALSGQVNVIQYVWEEAFYGDIPTLVATKST